MQFLAKNYQGSERFFTGFCKVEHTRRHRAAKHGGAESKLSMDEALGLSDKRDVDLLALDEALTSLVAIDSQKSRMVESLFRSRNKVPMIVIPQIRPENSLASDAPGAYD